ncbi:MAG TPA: hypothetical protein VFP98_05005, partial [Candidatus Polarisedimenticolia bacterium]|nr:hypothetical protein [Candidatus Polarisedimenticolia bacterium]
MLAVADGDSIVAVYEDQDDGSGVPRQVEAVARVSDCRAPVISDVRLSRLSPGFFTVEWRTSEPADSRVLYGSVPALGSEVSSPDLTTVHAVTVTGIAPCSRTFFTVASSDALGNLAREDDTSGLRTLDTPSDSAIYLENFDTGAAGWSHSGQDDLWEFTQPSSGPSTGTPVASTGPGGPIVRPPLDINSDFALLSPPINLEGIQNPKLSFRHRYDFTFSAQGGDGGWIEAWDGAAWVIIAPVGGYPALLDLEAGRTGVRPMGYSGTLPAFADAVFDLSGLLRPGAAITRFRFRVFVDGGTGPTGSGWRIDDVSVSGTLACREGRLAFERQSGACGTSSLPLSLHDLDLDLDPGSPDTAMVQVSSTGGPGPMTLVMTEAAASVGLLRGSVPLSEDGAPGTLRALPGDLLTALYQDADDGSGASAARTATFTAGACTGPAIHRVQLEPVGADSVIGRWSTDQPSIGALSLSSGSGQILTGGDLRMGTSHQVTIRGLDPCTLYSGTIWSENGDGIRSTVSGPAGALSVETVLTDRIFFDDAEGPDPGWQVAGLVPEWQRGVPTFGPDTAFSGQRVIATDLGGLYDGGANATLISPPIDLTGAPNPRLGFWHWYDIFASGPPLSFDDAAWVEVQDVKTGTIQYIEPVGGYTDVTDQEGGDPLHLGTPVYACVSNDWERAVFDLSPYAGKVVRVRFRIWNDLVELLLNQHTGAGWYLDDVEVSAPEYCFPAPILEPQGPLVLPQGASLGGIEAGGSGFREGAVASSAPGVRIGNVSV